MEFTAQQIADFLQGTIEGNPNVSVHTVAKIEEGHTGALSFLANPKYEPYIYSTHSSIVLVNKTFKPEKQVESTLIRVEDAYVAFAKLLELYNKTKNNKNGIEQPCFIDSTAKIGENVYIGAFSYIGKNVRIENNVQIFPQTYLGDNVEVGENSVLYSGVKVYFDCKIGKNCILHSGVVVGSDGFGFAPQEDCTYKKIPQIGNVIIEDNVEIGANTTIDRATLGSTILRKGVKLDNLIQIAHNVEIGENTVVAALSGVSGSTKIGKNCVLAGQVGIVGHLNIGDNITIGAQSGVTSNLKDNSIVLGSPALPISDFRKAIVVFKRLPDLDKQISELKKQFQQYKSENQ